MNYDTEFDILYVEAKYTEEYVITPKNFIKHLTYLN